MKALSVKQPYAWLMAKGIKDVENRGWRTNYRGRIYIHASVSHSSMDVGTLLHIRGMLSMTRWLEFLHNKTVYGAIIGEVDIVDCVTESSSPWFEGKYGFVLANAVMYDKPIPYRGQLGLFEVQLDPDEVRAARGN